MARYDDVLSIFKSHQKEESSRHIGFDYDEHSKSEQKEYRYFEGHDRGHKHERHGK